MVSTSFEMFFSFTKTKWRSLGHIEVESSGDPHPTLAKHPLYINLAAAPG
jgi:hypothetical protein